MVPNDQAVHVCKLGLGGQVQIMALHAVLYPCFESAIGVGARFRNGTQRFGQVFVLNRDPTPNAYRGSTDQPLSAASSRNDTSVSLEPKQNENVSLRQRPTHDACHLRNRRLDHAAGPRFCLDGCSVPLFAGAAFQALANVAL